MNSYIYFNPVLGRNNYQTEKEYDLTNKEHCIELARNILDNHENEKILSAMPRTARTVNLYPKDNSGSRVKVFLGEDEPVVYFENTYFFSLEGYDKIRTFKTFDNYNLDTKKGCENLVETLAETIHFFPDVDLWEYDLYDNIQGEEKLEIYLHKSENEPPFITVTLTADIQISTTYNAKVKGE